ncbi:hypothetical protein K439DRAFT_1352179 [Ramaria rubella]|nr:hypothetical protein K439DRAFT_1352179 [Ramaria rubella]
MELRPLISDSLYQNLELEPFLLPSDFGTHHRHEELGLTVLAEKERLLREGEANDALEHICLSIKQFNVNFAFKKKQVRGQRDNTCSHSTLNANVADRNKHVGKYHATRTTLIALGMSAADPVYWPLMDEDIFMKDATLPHELGDGTHEESWIWKMGNATLCSAAQCSEWENVDHVQWFWACANRDRWHEEVEIVEEEFARTCRSFTRMANVWTELGDQCSSSDAGLGRRVYAYQQAAMSQVMAGECQRRLSEALGRTGQVVSE